MFRTKLKELRLHIVLDLWNKYSNGVISLNEMNEEASTRKEFVNRICS